MGIDHDAAFIDILADFVLGTALVFARIGGTVEGAHNQLGTSSTRGRGGKEREERLDMHILISYSYRLYLLVMLELINIALAIYRFIILEPGHLRRRSSLHLADDPQLLAVIHCRVARRRADRRDRCVLCCKTQERRKRKEQQKEHKISV